MRRSVTASIAMALIAGAAQAAVRDDPDEQLATILTNRIAGAPVDCIAFSPGTSSQIVAGRAIVYRVGGTLYVNRLRSGADRLRDDDVLVMQPFGSQLCRIDNIQLFDRFSAIPRGFVVLDRFVPYRTVKARTGG